MPQNIGIKNILEGAHLSIYLSSQLVFSFQYCLPLLGVMTSSVPEKSNKKVTIKAVQTNGACALHSGPLPLAFQDLFPYGFYFQLMPYFILVSVQRLGVFFFVLFQVPR